MIDVCHIEPKCITLYLKVIPIFKIYYFIEKMRHCHLFYVEKHA